MNTEIQTLARVYRELCEVGEFRIAIGNFMNEFFLYHCTARERQTLIDPPIQLPNYPIEGQREWAAFCAGAAEYLARRYRLRYPAWAKENAYALSTPWYMLAGLDTPAIRASLEQDTPEPWRRRNVFCSHRIFTNPHPSSKEPGNHKELLQHRQQMLEQMSPEKRVAYIEEYNARVPRWMRIPA